MSNVDWGNDFIQKDWSQRNLEARNAEADGVTASQLDVSTKRLQTSIIDQLEDDNRVLLGHIRRLEARLAEMENDAKFMKARDAALLAEVRALIEEIKKCPDDHHVHELHVKEDDGHMPLFDVFKEAFVDKANEVGLDDPESYLTAFPR